MEGRVSVGSGDRAGIRCHRSVLCVEGEELLHIHNYCLHKNLLIPEIHTQTRQLPQKLFGPLL